MNEEKKVDPVEPIKLQLEPLEDRVAPNFAWGE